MEKLNVIIAAAGKGTRLGMGMNKAFVKLAGVPIIVHNLRQLNNLPDLGTVFIVVGSGELTEAEKMLKKYQTGYFPLVRWQLVAGGRQRQDSVANALAQIKEKTGWIAVHDGARPFAASELFAEVWSTARKTGAAIAAVPCKDTIKEVNPEKLVNATLERSRLWAVQTPQIFSLELLRKAYAQLQKAGNMVTDDAGAVEQIGGKVAVVMGNYKNIKITTPDDLILGEAFIKGAANMADNIHVGSGFDVHRLVPDRKLILCGVTIPYTLGLLGHSDADVALHALMDAMLGAAGFGDIGKLFPDTDPAFKDADSMVLLKEVIGKLQEAGWQVNNADVTIIAQKPKLASYREAMEKNLSNILHLTADAINVKATTTEQLGFTGRGEGIASQAVVTIKKI
jgi:2-C-methyl-D-erythritol 4-phosphate cytidylyltransferase/2-C-methyl-D-erythritol 2,4-cyclodiphosphate synthase